MSLLEVYSQADGDEYVNKLRETTRTVVALQAEKRACAVGTY